MADGNDLPPLDPRLVDIVRDAIARGVQRTEVEEPVDRPPVITGKDVAGFNTRDAAVIREISRQVLVDLLRDRHLLSEMEIKGVAKDIAHAIVEKAVSSTEEQIEEIVVAKLKEVGIRADSAHIDETRKALEGIQDAHKRRIELSGEFVKELIKAIAQWSFAGVTGALGMYLLLKGGASH